MKEEESMIESAKMRNRFLGMSQMIYRYRSSLTSFRTVLIIYLFDNTCNKCSRTFVSGWMSEAFPALPCQHGISAGESFSGRLVNGPETKSALVNCKEIRQKWGRSEA